MLFVPFGSQALQRPSIVVPPQTDCSSQRIGRHPGSLAILDPAANLSVYRRALLQRFHDQIRLLRAVPYWYLLPLFGPGLWSAVSQWHRVGWMALAPLAVLVAVFAFIGWLTVKVAVGGLRAARDQVAKMATEVER